MFTEFVKYVMARNATYEFLKKEKVYFGSIKNFQGVWATGRTKKECAEALQEVLEEWLLLKIRKQQFVPSTRKYDLNKLLAAA